MVKGSSRNRVAAWWCFSSGCPIYQRPKWFQFCSTQQNEECLVTSIFISMLCCVTTLAFIYVGYSERLQIDNIKVLSLYNTVYLFEAEDTICLLRKKMYFSFTMSEVHIFLLSHCSLYPSGFLW